MIVSFICLRMLLYILLTVLFQAMTTFNWATAFTSDEKKIAENRKLTTVHYEKEKQETGCRATGSVRTNTNSLDCRG